MKFPIEWHEACLANASRTLDDMRRRIESMQRNYEFQKTKNEFYESQIAQAKARGLTEFDPHRLGVKRK